MQKFDVTLDLLDLTQLIPLLIYLLVELNQVLSSQLEKVFMNQVLLVKFHLRHMKSKSLLLGLQLLLNLEKAGSPHSLRFEFKLHCGHLILPLFCGLNFSQRVFQSLYLLSIEYVGHLVVLNLYIVL